MRVIKLLLAALGIAGLAVAIGVFAYHKSHSLPNSGRQKAVQESAKPVKVAKPSIQQNSKIETRQICLIESLHKADLNTRIPGIVSKVTKDIGDRVTKGELLLELDTPDIRTDIGSKEQSVLVKEAEARASKAGLVKCQAGILGIKSKISQAQASLSQSEALLDFRARRLARYNNLAKEDTVTADLVDEQIREHKAAAAGVEAAKSACDLARSMMVEKEAEIASAMADLDLKNASIELARKELEKARAQLALASIVAPFDGILAKRAVDPGDFVSAPSGVSRDPMLSIISDTLQIVSHFPDNFSGKIFSGTQLLLTLDSVPGKSWPGRITRVAPLVSTQDRTIRVEIDVFDELVTMRPANCLLIRSGDRNLILPGVSGEIRVEVSDSAGSASIPSAAIVNRGGQSVVILIVDGVVNVKPVQVVINDGKKAIVRVSEGTANRPSFRNLRPDDLVAISRQAELVEGDKVTPVEEGR